MDAIMDATVIAPHNRSVLNGSLKRFLFVAWKAILNLNLEPRSVDKLYTTHCSQFHETLVHACRQTHDGRGLVMPQFLNLAQVKTYNRILRLPSYVSVLPSNE